MNFYLTEDHGDFIILVAEDGTEVHLKYPDIFQQILGVAQLVIILGSLDHDCGPV